MSPSPTFIQSPPAGITMSTTVPESINHDPLSDLEQTVLVSNIVFIAENVVR